MIKLFIIKTVADERDLNIILLLMRDLKYYSIDNKINHFMNFETIKMK